MDAKPQLDWDDVRVFLAVMRSSSLREAGERLCVSHPTVRRRLEALENRLSLRLFDRRSDGLHATPHAMELLPSAEDAERAIDQLSRKAMAADPSLQGDIRVTMPDLLATDLLMPAMSAFCQRWPEIELGIDVGYDLADLGKRQADVAVRLMRHGTLPDEALAGRRVVTVYRAVYGRGDHCIGWSGGNKDDWWLKDSPFPDLPIRGAIENPSVQLEACKAGLGLSMLPCFLADPYLDQLTEPEPAFDAWVLVHPDLRRNPRLRVFRDAIVEALKEARGRLEGRRDSPQPWQKT